MDYQRLGQNYAMQAIKMCSCRPSAINYIRMLHVGTAATPGSASGSVTPIGEVHFAVTSAVVICI